MAAVDVAAELDAFGRWLLGQGLGLAFVTRSQEWVRRFTFACAVQGGRAPGEDELTAWTGQLQLEYSASTVEWAAVAVRRYLRWRAGRRRR